MKTQNKINPNLNEALNDCNLDYCNQTITESNFPWTGVTVSLDRIYATSFEVSYDKFGTHIVTDKYIDTVLRSDNERDATLEEYLLYLKKVAFRVFGGREAIIVVRNVISKSGTPYALLLQEPKGCYAIRNLKLIVEPGAWNSSTYHFLVVKK